MWPSSYTGNKNNCAVLPQYRFRANDFYMFNLQDGNLAPISRINGESSDLKHGCELVTDCCRQLGLWQGHQPALYHERYLQLLGY